MEWSYIRFEKSIEKVTYTTKIPKKKFLSSGNYPIISQEAEFINGYWDNKDDVFDITDPVVIFGDHTKVVKHIDFNFVLGADGVKVLKPINELNSRFFAYFLESAPVADLGYARHYRLLKEISVPLPPIPEQKRIVAILDQAFADIEQARAKTEQNLKNARELFESYLQQVFSQRGEGVIEVPLSEITESISDGDHAAPPKSEEGIPFITISNINKLTNEIDFTNTFKVPDSYYSALKITRKPLQGDVLYTVTGSYGIPVIVKEEKEFCFQRHIGLVRPNNDTDSNWLYYLLMSPQVFKQADEGATGTAQKTVSLKLLRGLRVPKVPLKEQVNMVEDLNLMYLKSKQLTEIYTRKLESLNELKNTILQKAFSGELTKTLEGGTNKGAVA